MIEDKIQKAIKPIISIYSQIELEIIEKIAEHFNLNEEFINSDYWYFEKLKELGELNPKVIKLLEQYTGKTKQDLLKAMNDIGISAIPKEQLEKAKGLGILFNPQMITIQNIIQYSYNEMENTFLQLNKTIEEQVKKTYTDIVTQTYIKTSSGIYSYQEAILQSLDELGNKGISVLTYQDKNRNIKNYDVVGTVRRDLLCATRGLAGKVNEEVIKESGNHIVRVSNHFGARTGDGEENYTNHAWWQEMQFFCWNYDGKATEEEKKLPDFMEHCNYGDVQGIVGINCKHFFTTWYGPLEKDKLDFTYEENEEQYKKTQQQRYLENGVRKWKRKQVIANKAEDEEGYKKASVKTKEWQDRLNTFTTENDLKRDYTREHIKDYKSSKYQSNRVKLEYEDITNNILSKEDKKFEVKEQQYFVSEDGKKYNIDGKNVKIKANEKERQVAELLGKAYGGQVNLVPVVLNPQGIKTPDYILNGKKYDLKEPTGSSKTTIYDLFKHKSKQADNFIIDIHKSGLDREECIKQSENIFYSRHRKWIDTIILMDNNEIFKILKRKQ